MDNAEWNCAEVPEWKEHLCCSYCHALDERSFTFQVAGKIKKLCCKYSLSFVQLHHKEEIIFLDGDLLLTPRP